MNVLTGNQAAQASTSAQNSGWAGVAEKLTAADYLLPGDTNPGALTPEEITAYYVAHNAPVYEQDPNNPNLQIMTGNSTVQLLSGGTEVIQGLTQEADPYGQVQTSFNATIAGQDIIAQTQNDINAGLYGTKYGNNPTIYNANPSVVSGPKVLAFLVQHHQV